MNHAILKIVPNAMLENIPGGSDAAFPQWNGPDRPRPGHSLRELGHFHPRRVHRHVRQAMAQPLRPGGDAQICYRSQLVSAMKGRQNGHLALRTRHRMFTPRASSSSAMPPPTASASLIRLSPGSSKVLPHSVSSSTPSSFVPRIIFYLIRFNNEHTSREPGGRSGISFLRRRNYRGETLVALIEFAQGGARLRLCYRH